MFQDISECDNLLLNIGGGLKFHNLSQREKDLIKKEAPDTYTKLEEESNLERIMTSKPNQEFMLGMFKNSIESLKLFINMLNNTSKEDALTIMNFTLKRAEEMVEEIQGHQELEALDM